MKLKNRSKKLFFIFFSLFIFVILVAYNMKYMLKTRAAGPELNLKIKLQGDFINIANPPIKAVVSLYTAETKIKEFADQNLIQENQNVFSIKLSLSDIDLTKIYAVFIKPEKYLGRLFCSQTVVGADCRSPQLIFSNNQNDIDLSQYIFLSGDLKPFDRKVSAYDLSIIIRNLGKIVSPSADTDINYDSSTDTQDYSLALYSLGQNAVDDPINFVLLSATPTPTAPVTPTVEPTQAPIGLIRPQKNLDQVLDFASKETCVPKGLFLAISSNENGLRFQGIDEARFTLFNTYDWWNKDSVTKDDLCFGLAYNSYDGNIPQDSKFPGVFCFPSPGDPNDQKIMGPVPISEIEWNAYKNSINKILGQTTTDRRVMLDAHLALGFHLKNISTYRGSDCNSWELKYMAKAACKYLGTCSYTDGLGKSRNYCIDMCNNYNKYTGTSLDCNSIPSIISEYEQCKIN